MRSWGSIRQQFSIAENIRMSQFGLEFLENLDDYLGIDGEESLDIQFKPGTYCFLASEPGRSILEENANIQRFTLLQSQAQFVYNCAGSCFYCFHSVLTDGLMLIITHMINDSSIHPHPVTQVTQP